MPLPTAADIALGTRAQQVQSVEYPAIKARYPNTARDAQSNVPNGYFDLVADADAMLAARGALLGTERRRFAVEVDGLIWFDALTYPGVRLIDADMSVDLNCLVARWEIDLDNEITRFELLG
jgi:hypothetical protein